MPYYIVKFPFDNRSSFQNCTLPYYRITHKEKTEETHNDDDNHGDDDGDYLILYLV